MSNFLTYSDVDSDIQRKMANATPSSTVRLAAINNSLNDLYARFDIESGKREAVFYAIPNGSAIELSTLVSDFKNPADLRFLAPNAQVDKFNYISDNIFSEHIGEQKLLNEYTTAFSSGNLFIKVNSSLGATHKTLHDMTTVGGDGTWAVTNDAVSITTTNVVTLQQSAAIEFDVTVATSLNNYATITNSTMTAVDLSDYTKLGHLRLWTYIPSVTNFTSVTVRWGSSSTTYWEGTETTQADGSALVAGWNELDFNWADAVQTGTSVDSAIDYALVQYNYTASYANQTGFRIETLEFYLPEPMKLTYYTYFLSQTTGGTFQEELTSTSTDELLLPKRYKRLIVLGAMKELLPEALGDDADKQLALTNRDYEVEARRLGLDIGGRQNVPVRKVKIR